MDSQRRSAAEVAARGNGSANCRSNTRFTRETSDPIVLVYSRHVTRWPPKAKQVSNENRYRLLISDSEESDYQRRGLAVGVQFIVFR